ncbi:hypothetical protein CCH79_00011265 [Gambusia affinis]|uniref:Sushi domain-containing protein n=1 Tax=Gambusia affinis TaxID=33528 RepID=A0A315V5Y2_GAMAF|nr:hypothetical protein CCH79_00011265 [Gambusia affinis]
MWLTGLRFALLVWIPGLLHAVSEKPCGVPNLEYGYFIPVLESYPHDSDVTYTCDAGYKTTKEGWWVTIVCQDGHWSEKPECVLETACLPPVIPNGKFMQYQNGSFEINCDKGYSLNGRKIECHSGTWSEVSPCQRQTTACGQPPAVPDAVVIQAYQEVFEASSKVEYQCRDGFVTEGRQSKKIANCTAGEWVGTPRCIGDGLNRGSRVQAQQRPQVRLLSRVQHLVGPYGMDDVGRLRAGVLLLLLLLALSLNVYHAVGLRRERGGPVGVKVSRTSRCHGNRD